MAEVIWTEPALQELDALAEYIALDNPAAANQLVSTVFEKTKRLDDLSQPRRRLPRFPTPFIGSWWHHPAGFFIVKMASGFLFSM